MSQKSNDRRDEIIAVAGKLFSEQGYSATTTRQITERLRMSPGALYYFFQSKAACLEGLVHPYLDRIEALLDEYPPHVRTDGQLRSFFTDYQQAIRANREVAQLVDRDVAIINDPNLGPRLATLTDRIIGFLSGPDADSIDRARASSALGAVRRPALRFAELDPLAARASVESAVAAHSAAK